jgi:hypothetical protein
MFVLETLVEGSPVGKIVVPESPAEPEPFALVACPHTPAFSISSGIVMKSSPEAADIVLVAISEPPLVT